MEISSLIKSAEVMKTTPSYKGFNTYFTENDTQRIASLKLDFLLRFGFNILRGDILKAARFGVWSFHHDDERLIRGGPPGFWEVFYKHKTNGVILQQLTDELDKGLILDRMQLPVISYSWKAHLEMLYSESIHMPARVAKMVQLNQYKAEASNSSARIRKAPTNHQMLLYWFLMIYRRTVFHLRTLFLQEDWNIGLIDAGIEEVIKNPQKFVAQVQWFKNKKTGQYLADPFLIKKEKECYLFAEFFDYRSGKGEITAAKASENYHTFRPVLDHNTHCSFPFVFIENGKMYCIPENFSSKQINLYQWDDQHERFYFRRTLLDAVAAIDPVLFKEGNFWWLLFGSKDLPSSRLFAWYTDSLENAFMPHPLNPVKTDIHSSRNAGKPLLINGQRIRFAQDSANGYGSKLRALALNISLTSFYEEPICEIKPVSGSPFPKGLHSINGTDELTIIDGKRFRFSLAGFRHQFLLKLKQR